MAMDSSQEGQNPYSISVFPDECPQYLQCELKLAISGTVEALTPFKSPILDHQSNCQDKINLQIEKARAYPPRLVDIDIEKGNNRTPMMNEEIGIGLQAEGFLNRVLHREISFYIGGKLMQHLINHPLMLLKFTSRDKSVTERKYKRSTSFNSRRIAVLFSVLSSIGTIILIYLTLRVRQMG